MKLKKLLALLMCGVLCGCSAEAVQANTLPAAVYITTTTEEPPIITTNNTEGITAEAITSPEVTTSASETTTSATSTTTTTTTTTTTAVTTTAPARPKQTTTTARKPKPVVYKNTIEITGPNVVYTGESFDYGYKISHRNAERASVLWQCTGIAGKLSADGKFEALEAGTVMLKVSDISNGLTDTLMVHVVDSPEDIDFVCEVNGIPIANKTYPVPEDYNPGLLDETYNAFMELKQGAYNDGIEINFMSGFRSYEEQMEVYANWNEVYPDGQADRVSARPGHSEHQLGLAIDVNSIEFTFADTPEGLWLAENCWKYGFVIRYREGTEHITGYMYEPWHIRYLGKELAEEVHFSGLTLEEYLGIDSWYRIEEYDFGDETEGE